MTECMRNLDVEIPAGEVERETTRIAQGFQRQARIPGFRPGKAPLSLVRQHFSGKIREEMLETLVPAHLRAAFERENLEPVSTPTLENLDYGPGTALKFKASFEVMPEIRLGDYRSIRVAAVPVMVNAQEVDEQVAALRERHGRREPSTATELSDGALAVVEARRLDDGAESKSEELTIEVAAPDTLPEFTAALRGMKPGEERELAVSYPAEYPNSAFAGKTQRYHLSLIRIESKILPELTNDFVREATGAESADQLRLRIGESLRRQREHEARHQAEEKIVDELLQQSPFPVPESLVDKQV
ncbi:MAG: trigger factor, partial [Terriglobales bacterium]